MRLYKDYPKLERILVTTLKGEQEYKVNCVRYKQHYYSKATDCLEINGMYYPYCYEDLIFNEFTQKWEIYNSNTVTLGIVDCVLIDRHITFIYGHFSKHILNEVIKLSSYGSAIAMDRFSICHLLLQSPNNYKWYIDKHDFNHAIEVKDYKGKGYCIEDNEHEFNVKKKFYLNYKQPIEKIFKQIKPLLHNYTFGVEYEFSKGGLPENTQMLNGIVMCRDGSVNNGNGGEAVTIPLNGAKGLQLIKNSCKEMTKFMEIDISCSMHIHIGNINTSRLNLITLYKLFSQIQNELYELFPYYRTDYSGYKDKDYCRKLLPIFPVYSEEKDFKKYVNDCYTILFTFLSDGYYPSSDINRKQMEHPVKQKWNRKNRKTYINFTNLLFSPRLTLESRLHVPTLNYTKTLNWLFITIACVVYAENNSLSILKGDVTNLTTIINSFDKSRNSIYAEFKEYLLAYVKARKKEMLGYMADKDFSGEQERLNDKDYTFLYNGKSFWD